MMVAKACNLITIFEKQGDKPEETYRYALVALVVVLTGVTVAQPQSL